MALKVTLVPCFALSCETVHAENSEYVRKFFPEKCESVLGVLLVFGVVDAHQFVDARWPIRCDDGRRISRHGERESVQRVKME